MRRFRKIVVGNVEYRWLFRYDDYDYINTPYLLILMSSAPKATLLSAEQRTAGHISGK